MYLAIQEVQPIWPIQTLRVLETLRVLGGCDVAHFSAHQPGATLKAAVLVVALKNLVHVPAEIIARDVVLYIIVYWALGLYASPAAAAHPTGLNRPLYRGALMIIITLAILAVYALRRP